jgi:hypothetical protein
VSLFSFECRYMDEVERRKYFEMRKRHIQYKQQQQQQQNKKQQEEQEQKELSTKQQQAKQPPLAHTEPGPSIHEEKKQPQFLHNSNNREEIK